MTRMIIHVGTHKTGTTALQFHFQEHEEWLKQNGVIYDMMNAPEKRVVREHHWLAKALASGEDRELAKVERYRAGLRDQAGASDTVLISTERIYREHCLKLGNTKQGRDAFLDRVAKFADGFDAEAVIVLRRPDRLAEAYFKEAMVNTNVDAEFDKLVEMRAPRFDYTARIKELRDRFKTVHVLCYEELCKGDGGLINGFSQRLGLPVPEDMATEPVRKSVSIPAAMWLGQAKRTAPVSEYERRTRWGFALSDQAGAMFENPEKKSLWADHETRRAFFDEKLAGFEFAEFWQPPTGEVVPFDWSDELHRKAETRFHAWKRNNWLKLKRAKALRRPPHAALPQLTPLEKGFERLLAGWKK